MKNEPLISFLGPYILHLVVLCVAGALFLQKVIERFSSLHSQGGNYGEGKQIDNVLVMLGNMYNFKVSDRE